MCRMCKMWLILIVYATASIPSCSPFLWPKFSLTKSSHVKLNSRDIFCFPTQFIVTAIAMAAAQGTPDIYRFNYTVSL